jgi:NADH dehydrogenase
MKKTSIVIAGGGFAGLSAAMYLDKTLARRAEAEVTMIHPGDFLLPELGQELGDYAERKLRERRVDVIKGVRVASYDGSLVTLTDGNTIPASTLIWTAGVKPSQVIAPLPWQKERGRLLVSEYLAVTGVPGLWASGEVVGCQSLSSPP